MTRYAKGAAENVKVRVYRTDARKRDARLVAFDVPYTKGMRVLTALEYIQEHLDPTLAFRWNCGAGQCGSCAAEVDGKPVLTCKTEIKPGTRDLSVFPLKVFPVVRDLVVDFAPAQEKLKGLRAFFTPAREKKPGEFYPMREFHVQAAQEMRKCIDCFICHDVCHVLRDAPHLPFVGPRNLVKAAAQQFHPLNAEDRTPLVEQGGLSACNVTRCCTEACPQGIQITQNAIIPLKERAVSAKDPFGKLLRKVLK